jgi:hypothetical protein
MMEALRSSETSVVTRAIRRNIQEEYILPRIGLWQWYKNIIITILDIIHHPIVCLKQRFGDRIQSSWHCASNKDKKMDIA